MLLNSPELCRQVRLGGQGLEVHVALFLLRALLIGGRVLAVRERPVPGRQGRGLQPRGPGDSDSRGYEISKHFDGLIVESR